MGCPSPATPRVRHAMVTVPKTHTPDTPVEEVRLLFDDDHVHMALVVAGNRLVTTIERSDLVDSIPGTVLAGQVGTLAGRVVHPERPLDEVTTELRRSGRRRLAVVDGSGGLLGLLCLKRNGSGYCSDEGVLARAADLVAAKAELATA